MNPLPLLVFALLGTQESLRPPTLAKSDLKLGSGEATAAAGDLVVLTYIGRRDDGSVFDGSDKTKIMPPPPEGAAMAPEFAGPKLPNNVPMGIVIGSDAFSHGFDQGLVGMKVGGIRKIVLEDSGKFSVPPGSHLNFEVTVWDILKKGKEDEVTWKDLARGKGKSIRKGKTIDLTYRLICMNGVLVDKGTVTIKAGNGDLIAPVDRNLIGLRLGARRQFRTGPKPLEEAVGSGGKIPPNQTMLFEVTVDKIR